MNIQLLCDRLVDQIYFCRFLNIQIRHQFLFAVAVGTDHVLHGHAVIAVEQNLLHALCNINSFLRNFRNLHFFSEAVLHRCLQVVLIIPVVEELSQIICGLDIFVAKIADDIVMMLFEQFIREFRRNIHIVHGYFENRVLAGKIRIILIRIREGHFYVEGFARFMADKLLQEIINIACNADRYGCAIAVRAAAFKGNAIDTADIIDIDLVAVFDDSVCDCFLVKTQESIHFCLNRLFIRLDIRLLKDQDLIQIGQIHIIQRTNAFHVTFIRQAIAVMEPGAVRGAVRIRVHGFCGLRRFCGFRFLCFRCRCGILFRVFFRLILVFSAGHKPQYQNQAKNECNCFFHHFFSSYRPKSYANVSVTASTDAFGSFSVITPS